MPQPDPAAGASAGQPGDAEFDDELTRLRQANALLTAELARRRRDELLLAPDLAAVHDSERRLRDTLESIDEGFLLVDRDWRVVDLNLRAVRMDGRPAARIVGRTLFELWPDTVSPDIGAVLQMAMRARQHTRLLLDHHANGRDYCLELRLFPSADGLALFFHDVKEQRAAEQRLLRAETSARLALDAARLGTWSFDPRTGTPGIGTLALDDQLCAMLGVLAGSAISPRMVAERIHPEDRARIMAAARVALDPDGTGEIAEEFRSFDAAEHGQRWFATMGKAGFENGVCIRFDGVVQEITERKRIAASLAESEARFRAITEATPGIVFVTDVDGMNTYVNPQFSEITGRPGSELLGEGWLDIVHPNDRARAAQAWLAAVRSGTPYQIEQRFRRYDGTYRWYLCRGTPLREWASQPGGEDRIVQWFGTAVDIQDQVEARQVLARDRDALERLVDERTVALQATLARLRDEEARMRALFQNSSECLFLLRMDPERGPVYVDLNPAGEAVLGRARDEVIGQTPLQVFDDVATAEDVYRRLQAAMVPGAAPYRYTARRRFAGQERVLDIVAVSLAGPDAERLILLSARDTTEQRALEEALRQSQKMEAIGQLTGGIAHDFNNLLTGIAGSLELMRNRAAQGRLAEVERYAVAAMESVRRAGSLVHRLLAFARRQSLDPKPADLNHLIAGMEELVARTVGPAIQVRTVLEPALWPTLCDANQLENALLNLCLNARDAMPRGGVLRIETANLPAAEDGREDAVCVIVSDTGTGMEPDVADRAFEPFFTTKPMGQGTGLGLSMLYGFVRQSGGQVTLDSEVGRGTTVRIELPRHLGSVPVDQAEPPAASPIPAGGDAGLILLVEDDAMVRVLAKDILREQGYRVLAAGDAEAGLRFLQQGAAVDLLLTDVGLPGMNGRELAYAAREFIPRLRVLFITGYAHQAGGDEGLLAPGMELLSKPFSLEALIAKVRAILTG